MTSAPTPRNVRRLLIDALKQTTPAAELSAWSNTELGGQPLYALAAAYVSNRHHDLSASFAGFDKTGEQVVAMVDAVSARAAAKQLGPPAPEVYQIPGTRAIAYVWRTKLGARPVVLNRAPKIRPAHLPANLPEEAIPPDFFYWPDMWQQVGCYETDEQGGVWRMEIDGQSLTWEIPPRPWATEKIPTDFEARCAEPGCEAETVAECGHETLEQKVGARFPEIDELRTPPAFAPGTKKWCPCGVELQPNGPDLCGNCAYVADGKGVSASKIRCEPCSSKRDGQVVYHLPPACDEPEAGPCRFCERPVCREEDGVACRSPGCPGNPASPPLSLARCGHTRDARLLGDSCPHPAYCTCHPCAGHDPGEGQDDPNKAAEGESDPRTQPAATSSPVEPPSPPSHHAKCKAEGDPATCRCVVGIPPEATCDACSHEGMAHDYRTGECARCDACSGWRERQGVSLDPGAPDDLRANPAWDPTRPVDLVDPKCRCGDARADHRDDADCTRCPCVRFREGEAVEIESAADRAADAEKQRTAYLQSLDMTKVTKQRIAKEYAQCQLCKGMIAGPTKEFVNGKEKTTNPGEQWVGPTAKEGKTVSMRHRAHLTCADQALEELKEKQRASTRS